MDSSSSVNMVIRNYAKGMSLLVVDDEPISLEICKRFFSKFFFRVDTAKDGVEAYDILTNGKRKYDLIITDILMPNMNGVQLIEKIRLNSFDQKIIVLSALNDLDELRNIITQGVDAIMLKPLNIDETIPVLLRVLKTIYNTKKLNLQLKQLKLIAQDNVKLKITNQKTQKESVTINVAKNDNVQVSAPKVQQESSRLIKKYGIRESVKGGKASKFMQNFDEYDLERVEAFLDNFIAYEANICKMETLNASDTKSHLQGITTTLYDFVQILNQFGSFYVAANAAENLLKFINNLKTEDLNDSDRKELFVSVFLALLEDIEKWIKSVFIDQDASNINYFDASFANTCLEIEAIFSNDIALSNNDDDLEFF